MVLSITYSSECSSQELEILQRFEEIIRDNWVQHACSTADLSWQIGVEDREPKRYAVLMTRTSIPYEVHRESFFSLSSKQRDAFKDEFMKEAVAYSSTQRNT